MSSTETKSAAMPLKSFLSAGPTLHYSHEYVHRFWGLTVAAYLLACFFWNRILIGGLISLVPTDVIDPGLWDLGRFVAMPVSIYEYPWQIVVLGTLMGVLATGPLLVSQLYSFRYSIPLILSVMFIGKLYFFGLFVAIGCVATACRPLRFRSRFISLALCMSPQILYWAIWGGYATSDPIRWGFSYAPWIYAWLTGLVMAAVVLGVGHYTRYRPGLIFTTTAVLLVSSYGIFQSRIGFAELDYQLYVAGNNPEEVPEFHSYSLSGILDAVIADDAQRSYLTGRYFPTDSVELRQRLRDEIEQEMKLQKWPYFIEEKMPDRLGYQHRRRELLSRYQLFRNRWPDSRRMPVALYYTALLSEFHPDIRHFKRTETLRFYNDYPFKSNILIWQELFNRFPQSPESLEARWRLARHDAAQGQFERAMELTQVARTMIREHLTYVEQRTEGRDTDTLFSAFQSPSPTVMTPYKLRELDLRLRELEQLISRKNQGPDEASRKRLARFISLNPYDVDYPSRLDALLREMDEDAPLRGNILLAKTLLIPDARQRAEALAQLAETYKNTESGERACYETALALLVVWKDSQPAGEIRRLLLEEIREILTGFLSDYPDSIYADQARSLLQTRPLAQ